MEDLLFERGYDLCHETVRLWWNRFGRYCQSKCTTVSRSGYRPAEQTSSLFLFRLRAGYNPKIAGPRSAFEAPSDTEEPDAG